MSGFNSVAKYKMENDSFYYNALIQNRDATDLVIGPMVAAFAETRATPILKDTTGWKVGLSRLSTFGATVDLPLWEAPLLGNTNLTTYVFTLTGTTAYTPPTPPIPTAVTITALNNTLTPITYSNFAMNGTYTTVSPVTLTIPIGSYTPLALATAMTDTLTTGGFPSVCSFSELTDKFTVQINYSPSPFTNVFTVDATNRTLGTLVNNVSVSILLPIASYSFVSLLGAIQTAMTGTFNGVACTATVTQAPSTLPGAGEASSVTIKWAPNTVPTTRLQLFGGAAGAQDTFFQSLGNLENKIAYQLNSTAGVNTPWTLATPQFGLNVGFARDTSTLFQLVGFTSANGYAANVLTTTINTTTGVTSRAPVVSPPFTLSQAYLDPTLITLSASAPIVWKPQHVGNPNYKNYCTSYQYVCRLVDDCFATIMQSLNAQLRLASGSPTSAFTTAQPTLKYESGIYTLVLDPAFVNPATEIFTLAQNLGCARWMPFPASINFDVDARPPQDCVLNPTNTIPTVYLDTSGGVLDGLKYDVAQEYDLTSNWAPFVGLTIVSSTIPANPELDGVTLVNTTSSATPTIGDASAPILFDMDLVGDSAHSYLSGISFSPTIMRFNSLTGSALSTIAFQVFLRKRDGTLVPWDVPRYGCIDLKLLFQYGN